MKYCLLLHESFQVFGYLYVFLFLSLFVVLQLSLAWSQFLEFFTLNKAILPSLRKEHHDQRVSKYCISKTFINGGWLTKAVYQSFQQFWLLSI